MVFLEHYLGLLGISYYDTVVTSGLPVVASCLPVLVHCVPIVAKRATRRCDLSRTRPTSVRASPISTRQPYKYARTLIFLCTMSEHPGVHLPRRLLAGFPMGCLTFFIACHPPLLGFREHSAVHSALVILDYFEIKHYFFSV